MPILQEKDLPKVLHEFMEAVLHYFTIFGFMISHEKGSYDLKISDDPIMTKLEINSRNGRNWFRLPGFSESYWPYVTSPGVYLFFCEDETACYVGKSEDTIGKRASCHVGKKTPDGKYSDCEFPEAHYLISIPFDNAPFLAPSLESFLLSNYEFMYNKNLSNKV
jgi:hypothetical protein